MKKKIIQLICLGLVLAVTFAAAPVNFSADAAATITTPAMVAGGFEHSVALKSDGSVWTWGDNWNGQIGIGTMDQYKTTPVKVNLLIDNIKEVAAGASHTVALRNDGIVWVWGINTSYQLGDVGITDVRSPLILDSLYDIQAIAAGEKHTVFLKDDGTVWSLGSNTYGQFGDGTTIFSATPVRAKKADYTNLNNIKAISSFRNFTVALDNSGGVWTWGANESGQLGIGSKTSYSATPSRITGDAKAVAAGSGHTVVLKNDGTVWTCGANKYGQLGLGSITEKLTLTKIEGLGNIQAIAAGDAHTIALQNGGTLLVWGANTDGQLGIGSVVGKTAPTQGPNLRDICVIAAGEKHSIAIKNDGTVWAWGSNGYGRLGDGTTTSPRTSPVQVKDPSDESTFLKVYGIAPSLLTINPTAVTLKVGEKPSFALMLGPWNVTHDTLFWETSNASVVSILPGGKITAMVPGTATITVKTINGLTATCVVTVTGVATASVTLSPTKKALAVGGSFTITPTVSPSNATNKTLTWESSNPGVAGVSSSGKVTAMAEGAATITAKTFNGKTATCDVTVTGNQPVTSVKLSSSAKDLIVGKSFTITPTISPSNATDKTVTWSSSKSSVASVSSGGKVTAKAAGTATITAKTSNGKTATCKVTVHTYVSLRIGYTAAIQNGVQGYIDNMGTKPFLISGKTMLPIRFVGEKMGATVTYVNDKTPIKLVLGKITVTFTLGQKVMYVNNDGKKTTVTLDVPAQTKDGKTYIPLRAIGEAFGFDVFYDSNTKIIVVNNPKMTPAIKTARLNEAKGYIK